MQIEATPAQRNANRRNTRKWPAAASQPDRPVSEAASLLQISYLRANWLRSAKVPLHLGMAAPEP